MKTYNGLFMRRGIDGLPENFKKQYACNSRKDAIVFFKNEAKQNDWRFMYLITERTNQ